MKTRWAGGSALVAAIAGAVAFALPAAGGTTSPEPFVLNPAATQTVVYASKTVGTIFKMAAGATANPFAIENSSATKVFVVGPAGDLTVGANKFTVAAATGNTSVGGSLTVHGATDVQAVNVFGELEAADGNFIVFPSSGDASLAGTLTVSGKSTLGQVNALGTTTLRSTTLTALTASGNATLDGNLHVGGSNFTVTASDGSFSAADSGFSVNGSGNISGAQLSVAGSLASAEDDFSVDASGNVTAVSYAELGDGFSADNSGNVIANTYGDGSSGFSVDGLGDVTAHSLTTGSTLSVSSLSTLAAVNESGELNINSGHFTVDTSGNVTAEGGVTAASLTVGAITVSGTIAGNGAGVDVANLRVTGDNIYTTSPTSAEATSTLTASQLLSNKIISFTTAGGTATLDTGANIEAAIPGVTDGDTFSVLLVNEDSSPETIANNTGTFIVLTALQTLAAHSQELLECEVEVTGAGSQQVNCF